MPGGKGGSGLRVETPSSIYFVRAKERLKVWIELLESFIILFFFILLILLLLLLFILLFIFISALLLLLLS